MRFPIRIRYNNNTTEIIQSANDIPQGRAFVVEATNIQNPNGPKVRNAERDAIIRRIYAQSDVTLQELGAVVGLSRQRIWEICKQPAH